MTLYDVKEVSRSKRRNKRVERFRKQYTGVQTEEEMPIVRKEKVKYKMGKINYPIFYAVLTLLSIGLIMIFSSSSYYSLYEKGDAYYFLNKEILSVVVGIVLMVILMGIDYHIYKKYIKYIYVGTAILLVSVFFFGDINGAHRWILIAGQSIQPSEFAKYSIVVFLAYYLDEKEDELSDFLKGPIKYLLLSGVYAALIYKQPNMSIAVVIMAVTFAMLFVAKCKLTHLFGLVGVAGLVMFKMMMGAEYRVSRWSSFLNPWADPSGESYQLIQSFYALGSGGTLGRGLGQSIQKALYMPEPHNDFIFSIIGEELGFVGCVAIIALFVFLILTAFKVADNAVDKFGSYIAIGITLVIAIQAVINIAVVSGSMPVTGVPLPFISYGGTSLAINLAAIGVLLNVSRHQNK